MVRVVPMRRPQAKHADTNCNVGLNDSRPAPPPSIAVHSPPPVVPEVPYSTYQPPTDDYRSSHQPPPDGPRSVSQPPSSGRKSVQFAQNLAVAESQPSEVANSSISAPEVNRNRRQRNGGPSRGYEAGNDTDSPPDEHRRQQSLQSQAQPIVPDANSGVSKRKSHRRRRSHDPSSAPVASSSRSQPEVDRNATTSPGSDETEDIPDRFDNNGEKKAELGDDPLANRLEQIINGKGLGRKLFGNFAEGLLGGNAGGGSGNGDDGSRRRW